MPTLSYKTIFTKYGIILRKFLESNIDNGGANWVPFSPRITKGSISRTLKKSGRTATKLQKDSGSHKRMIITGNTKKKAFRSRAEDLQLTLFVDSQYQDIIEGNNLGGEFYRKNQVTLFPIKASEQSFANTEPMLELQTEMQKFTEYYYQNIVDKDLNRTVKIG